MTVLVSSPPIPAQAGIGLRSRHFREILKEPPPVAWMETHPENYFGDGGLPLRVLEQIRARYPFQSPWRGVRLLGFQGSSPARAVSPAPGGRCAVQRKFSSVSCSQYQSVASSSNRRHRAKLSWAGTAAAAGPGPGSAALDRGSGLLTTRGMHSPLAVTALARGGLPADVRDLNAMVPS